MMDFDAIGADKSGPDMQDSDQMSLGSGEPISPDVWDQHDGDAGEYTRTDSVVRCLVQCFAQR